MLFFMDVQCDNDDVKGLSDVARILKIVANKVEKLANEGKGRDNIVEPILSNNGKQVGEWEWLVDDLDYDKLNDMSDEDVENFIKKIEKVAALVSSK